MAEADKPACNADGAPRISVVVPAYNAAAYLHESIGSLLVQTLAEVEFVIVDDCSTDDSLAIMQEYARRDARVKCIHLPRNAGTFMARKAGVMKASAPYVTFMDPDDSMPPDACRLFVAALDNASADIVHGDAEVVCENDISPARIDHINKLVRPKCAELDGRAILRALVDEKINPALWGKAFSTSIVKRANSMIPDGRYLCAEDYLLNFVVCCLARRYVSLKDKVYHYEYGRGLFGAANRDINCYKAECARVDILHPLRQVVGREFADDAEALNALGAVEDQMIALCYRQIHSLLTADEERKAAFSFLLSKTGGLPLVKVLASRYYGKCEKLSFELAAMNAVRKCGVRQIRTVGIFYCHFSPDGVQSVIANLIPLFKALGRKVVLILEQLPDGHGFTVPEGVDVEHLPAVTWSNREKIGLRIQELAEIIERHDIGLLYHHAFESRNLLWDMLLCKWALGIPVVIHYHAAACFRPQPEAIPYLSWPALMKTLSFADGVVTTSRADERWMRLFRVAATYLPSPIPFDIASSNRSTARHEIVWALQASGKQSQPDAVKILSIVRKKIPDATLTIVGDGTEASLRRVAKAAVSLGMEGAVEVVDGRESVRPYYERASIYLHTSDMECFPMSVLEAASFGMPIVMYDLPWLEVVRSAGGIVQVPQSDTAAAAAAIVSILTSRERADAMGKANQEAVRTLARYDLRGAWDSALSRLEHGEPAFDCEPDFGDSESAVALARQFMHCYAHGVHEKSRRCASRKSPGKKSSGSRVAKFISRQVRKALSAMKCLRKNG